MAVTPIGTLLAGSTKSRWWIWIRRYRWKGALDMARTTQRDRTDGRGRTTTWFMMAGVSAALLGSAVLVALSAVSTDQDASDDLLPNPMGGPTRAAPGEATGDLRLGGLEISGAQVAMGDVALDVTYVPGWVVTNPTDRDVAFTTGEPQVLEGCCPGPIYVDGELTRVEESFDVPPGGSVLMQFPLQMHAGMGGPHHLTVPLLAEGEQTEVHVTGDFSADAAA